MKHHCSLGCYCYSSLLSLEALANRDPFSHYYRGSKPSLQPTGHPFAHEIIGTRLVASLANKLLSYRLGSYRQICSAHGWLCGRPTHTCKAACLRILDIVSICMLCKGVYILAQCPLLWANSNFRIVRGLILQVSYRYPADWNSGP